MKLPEIMVAPNGARRTKSDHPAIPVTIPELVETAKACLAAGAGAMHAHVRDENQQHVLDAGLYRELIAEMDQQVPSMALQITTEAVGRYSPEQQRKLVKEVMPKLVSVSLSEMLSDKDEASAIAFYDWCHEANIAVQHILYSSDELDAFLMFSGKFARPVQSAQLLFVLGRYAKNQESEPDQLIPFVEKLKTNRLQADWAVCAFGRAETLCAQKAFQLGGKCRIGFENSLWNQDGSLAQDNAERIKEVRSLLESH